MHYFIITLILKSNIKNINVFTELKPFGKTIRILGQTWEERFRSTINQQTSNKYSPVFCWDVSFWIKGLSLKKRQQTLCIPHCGNNSVHYMFTPLSSSWLPMWAHVFHFCFECQQIMWHKQRAGCLCLGVCGDALTGDVYFGQCCQWAVWTPDWSLMPNCHLPTCPLCPAEVESTQQAQTNVRDALPWRLLIIGVKVHFRFICPGNWTLVSTA